MEDREVGNIWGGLYAAKTAGQQSAYITDCALLIEKLVEERANLLVSLGHATAGKASVNWAIRDFGINPQTWPVSPARE